jgi:hypothetical protein
VHETAVNNASAGAASATPKTTTAAANQRRTELDESKEIWFRFLIVGTFLSQ